MSSNAAAQGLRIESQDLGSGKAAKYYRVDLDHFDVRVLEPIREVWIHDEGFAASRLSMMRIMARRTKAATVIA